MFNPGLLRDEVQNFLRKNYKKDIPSLILKGSPFPDISVQELAVQLKGLQIAEKKFPRLFETEKIIYPPKLNLEQTSSEITAGYKAELVSGKTGIDLTGGLGIDTYFLSQNFNSFDYCELNTELAEIAKYNFGILNAENISVHNANSLDFLDSSDKNYDWVYADPARRDDSGGKVFKLEDCEPNIPENIESIFRRTDKVLIKTSPILDISAGILELKHVKEVHVVSVRNEVKELLWVLEKGFTGSPEIITVNFEKNKLQEFSANMERESELPDFSLPENYLYEPNASIMKSGLFNSLAHSTETKKLHPNSHLYTSESVVDFPGRSFQIIELKSFKDPYLKKKLKSKKANITTRNFPDSVENIRKKYKIKDGGELYVFFTTNLDEKKILIFCSKI